MDAQAEEIKKRKRKEWGRKKEKMDKTTSQTKGQTQALRSGGRTKIRIYLPLISIQAVRGT